MPLCWRCTGIAIGCLLLLGWLLRKKRVPPLPLSVALALLLPLDVLYAVLTGGQGDNARRLLTGVLWGIFGTSLFLRFVKRAANPSSASNTAAPTRMTDDGPVAFRDWSQGYDPGSWLDRSIHATRSAAFPALGLDPQP